MPPPQPHKPYRSVSMGSLVAFIGSAGRGGVIYGIGGVIYGMAVIYGIGGGGYLWDGGGLWDVDPHPHPIDPFL